MRRNLSTWSRRINFFNADVFPLSSLVTGPSFISISWLILELWQFWFKKDCREVRKSEIALSGFFPIFRDWDKLRIPNLAWMSLIKTYWIMRNARVVAFNASELLRKNQDIKIFILNFWSHKKSDLIRKIKVIWPHNLVNK